MDTFIAAMRDADRHLDDAKLRIAAAIEAAQTWPRGANDAANHGAEAETLCWSACTDLFKANKHGWDTDFAFRSEQRAAR